MCGHLIVFARSPVAGTVKTRLARDIGQATALEAYRELLRLTLEAGASLGCSRELCVAGDSRHGEMRRWAHDLGYRITTQVGDDLGARMSGALHRALQSHRRAVLVGCDCPLLDASLLARAFAALRTGNGKTMPGIAQAGDPRAGDAQAGNAQAGNAGAGDPGQDAVFAPTEDGGYVLVGLSRAIPTLFEAIEWGGSQVMERSRERLRTVGLRWHELDTVWDVDTVADYHRWRGTVDTRSAQTIANTPLS